MSRWMRFCHDDTLLEVYENTAWHHVHRRNRENKRKVWTTWKSHTQKRKMCRNACHQLADLCNQRLKRIAFCDRWYKKDLIEKRRRDILIRFVANNTAQRHQRVAFRLWH